MSSGAEACPLCPCPAWLPSCLCLHLRDSVSGNCSFLMNVTGPPGVRSVPRERARVRPLTHRPSGVDAQRTPAAIISSVGKVRVCLGSQNVFYVGSSNIVNNGPVSKEMHVRRQGGKSISLSLVTLGHGKLEPQGTVSICVAVTLHLPPFCLVTGCRLPFRVGVFPFPRPLCQSLPLAQNPSSPRTWKLRQPKASLLPFCSFCWLHDETTLTTPTNERVSPERLGADVLTDSLVIC